MVMEMWLSLEMQSSAKGSKTRPAAVRVTLPPPRSKRRTPIAFSSEEIWAEIEGWVTKSLTAAREKLFCRETSRNVVSWSKSKRHLSFAVPSGVSQAIAVGDSRAR